MSLNGVEYGVRIALHQEAMLGAHAPQRYCGCREPAVDSSFAAYSVAGSNVVQRKVAERVNDLVAERCRNGERPAINNCSRRGCRKRASVADGAADLIEQRRACVDISIDGTAPRRSQSPHKVGEGRDILSVVFRVGHAIKWSRRRAQNVILGGLQRAGYAHLVEVGISRE